MYLVSQCLSQRQVHVYCAISQQQRVILHFQSVFIHRGLLSLRLTHLSLLVNLKYIPRHISHLDKSCFVNMQVRSRIFPWMNHPGFHLWKDQISVTPDIISSFIGHLSLSFLYFLLLLPLSFGRYIVEAFVLTSRMQGCTVCLIKFTSSVKAIYTSVSYRQAVKYATQQRNPIFGLILDNWQRVCSFFTLAKLSILHLACAIKNGAQITSL